MEKGKVMVNLLDKRLIDLLTEDAHQSSEVLAKQLRVSSSTVRRRINKLLQQKVIRIIAKPDPGKIGLPLAAMIGFDVAHESLSSVIDELSKRPEVKWLSATSGRYDITALVWFPSTDELYNFMESEVAKLEGVRNTETFVCLHVKKRF
ncbi:Lrp/AsnC family transcriptional regulator [Chloroflexota bacterium]